MTQYETDLLLKDLCGRLPYGVKGRVTSHDCNNRECEFVATIDGKLYDRFAVTQESWFDNVIIKPYLFPLSSMTEEQKEELDNMFKQEDDICEKIKTDNFEFNFYRKSIFDFLNKYHFDWRGFIPKDLAIDATGLNIY